MCKYTHSICALTHQGCSQPNETTQKERAEKYSNETAQRLEERGNFKIWILSIFVYRSVVRNNYHKYGNLHIQAEYNLSLVIFC